MIPLKPLKFLFVLLPTREPRGVNRRGMALFIVIVALVVLSIFVLAYHRTVQHSQWLTARFERSERLRLVVESAMEEAFQHLSSESLKPDSSFCKWLLDTAPGGTAGNFSVPIPVSLSLLQSMVGRQAVATIEATARVYDFQTRDHQQQPFSGLPNEGIGTLELSVEASVRRSGGSGGLTTGCRFVTHVEFKTASLVTPRAVRNDAYCSGGLLDYVLFVRQGAGEFEYDKSMLNSSRTALEVSPGAGPDSCGLVFFGGTENRGKHVFLNIDEPFAGMIPTIDGKRELLPIIIGYRDCLVLAPNLKKYEGTGALKKLKGRFEGSLEPVFRPDYSTSDQRKLEESTLQELSSPQIPNEPGFRLLGPDLKTAADPALAQAALCGRIRQRFLRFVTFRFDFSDISGVSAEELKELTRPHICLDVPPPAGSDQGTIDFRRGLAKLAQDERFVGKVLSRIQDEYLYSGGLSYSFKPPEDATFQMPPSFGRVKGVPVTVSDTAGVGRPFKQVSLWSRRFPTVADLEAAGILNRTDRTIHLNGMVQLFAPLRLDGDSWTIEGRGGIIADGFEILGGIEKKKPEDLCVFITRNGTISLKTSKPVNAVLIAAQVIPSENMEVNGALMVNRLYSQLWKSGTHRLVHDPLLRSSVPVMTVHLSRWISFGRITDYEESARESEK